MDESIWLIGIRVAGKTNVGYELAEWEPLYRETAHLSIDSNRYGRAGIVSMISGAYRRRQGEGVA
jgi:hypothetical protein